MSIISTFMVMFAFSTSSAEGLSRQQLGQLIESAQESNCRDVSFDYEGRQIRRDNPASDGVILSYTGSFSRRSDGASLVDIYALDKTDGMASRSIVAILDGTTGFSSRKANQKEASISIKKQGPLQYAGTGNYRVIWLADFVQKLTVSNYRYEYE